MEKLSVRIVVCDHYMSPPIPNVDVTFSEFRGADIRLVPVLRIFGPSTDGLKTCLHVHGVFPYFYIPCANPDPQPKFLYQIANSLDKALNISLKQATSHEQHVYKISLVRGIPFYGYHTREHLFFKIFLYNPNHLKQAVELFQNGAILGQAFQAYEAHLNFTLQFFIDFNLFGMSCIDLDDVKFRRRDGEDYEGEKPISYCLYEADCLACNILNRQRVEKNDGQDNPGLEAVWNEENDRRKRLNLSLNQILSPTQPREGIQQTDTHKRFKSIFRHRMLSTNATELESMSLSFDSTIRSPGRTLNHSLYPVESIGCSNNSLTATEITFHHPSGSHSTINTTGDIDMNDTVVDEALAMNCSLSQEPSQVTLSSGDIAFAEMLESMEDKADTDSIIGTPINQVNPDDSDSDDYSKTFTEGDTIVDNIQNSLDMTIVRSRSTNSNDYSQIWEDSFWDGVDNIPQLDGANDDIDSSTPQLRRSARSLGMSRNKSKNTTIQPKKKKIKLEPPDTDVVKTEDTSLLYDTTNNFFPAATSSSNIKTEAKALILRALHKAPTASELTSTMTEYDLPEHRYCDPFYSNRGDVSRKMEIGSVVLKLLSGSVTHLKPFESGLDTRTIDEWRNDLFLENNNLSQSLQGGDLDLFLATNRRVVLRSLLKPPSLKEVKEWINRNIVNQTPIELIEKSKIEETKNDTVVENIDEDSLYVSNQPDGSFLCSNLPRSNESQNSEQSTIVTEADYLTVMVIEVHTDIRGNLTPDPEFDSIKGLFFKITNDCPPHTLPQDIIGIIVVDPDTSQPGHNPLINGCGVDYTTEYVQNEAELFESFLKIYRQNDPDIICGYEIETQSWGYLIERAQHLGIHLIVELSRVVVVKKKQNWRSSQEDNELKFVGRVAFSLWRLLRHEVALSSYTFENCAYHIVKERIPVFSHRQLSEWWNNGSLLRWMTIEHYVTRICGIFKIMDNLDLIKRTSELARLFGLQWWEVFSRGSQFRVESLMLRAARPLNLIAYSPSVAQRAVMKAPEVLPLILEPESRFYSDPVIVLDFQSLYPSMMIAYNYCFSTCIGRVQNMGRDAAYEFGAWQLRVSRDRLKRLASKDAISWSPVGVGFIKPSVRRGVLPALLRRILAARLAVKKGAKLQTDERVKKAMHARQLGLKLIANVTYGYTAANFSGRMPCVEVADSVVAKGRETLERAIKLVEKTEKWNARVVYGDTDSMFVLVKGRSRHQAFEIGAEIAAAVTADNPSPVALKLEKVYQPCILQTKKRYVGYLFENEEQVEPEFEAKGIETVRRDGCLASVKLLDDALRELFDSRDMSKVRELVCRRLSSLIEGRMPLLDLVFTREFHGIKGYKNGAAAPPLEIAKRLLAADRRSLPLRGERVGWIVAAGAPSQPLLRLARSLAEMRGFGSQPHVAYYITRAILPPLARCLSLVGADVFQWYEELPRRHNAGLGGIAQYLWKETCSACGVRTFKSLCDSCMRDPPSTMYALQDSLQNYSSKSKALTSICKSCCGNQSVQSCIAVECPVFWKREIVTHYFKESEEIIIKLSEYDFF